MDAVAIDRSLLEGLAERFREPIELVEQVYRAELVSVESDARIRAFLPIIARRRARATCFARDICVEDVERGDRRRARINAPESRMEPGCPRGSRLELRWSFDAIRCRLRCRTETANVPEAMVLPSLRFEIPGLLLALSRARSAAPNPHSEIFVLVHQRAKLGDVSNLIGMVIKADYASYRVFVFDDGKRSMTEIKYSAPVPFSKEGVIASKAQYYGRVVVIYDDRRPSTITTTASGAISRGDDDLS